MKEERTKSYQQIVVTIKYEFPIWIEVTAALCGIAVILTVVAMFWKLNLIQAY